MKSVYTRRSAICVGILSSLGLLSASALSSCSGHESSHAQHEGSERVAGPIHWNAEVCVSKGALSGEELGASVIVNGQAETSRIDGNDDRLFIGAGNELRSYSKATGELLCTQAIDGSWGNIEQALALAGDYVLVFCRWGRVAAFDADTLEARWNVSVISVEDEDVATQLEGSDQEPPIVVGWESTDFAIFDGNAYIGVSSYELAATSRLACIDIRTGTLQWNVTVDSRIIASGNLGYPYASPYGLLVPAGTEAACLLVSYADGEIVQHLEVDDMITTGFSHDGEAGDVVYFQTRRGTLCRVAFDGDGQAHISCSTDGLDDDKRTPSGAMPLVFDGYVLVNAPTIDESAGSTVLDPDHDASNGACNVFDAETLELVGSVPAREIESTPTLVDGSAVYLGEGGIYRIGLDELPNALEMTELTTEVHRTHQAWDQPLLVEDGTAYVVSGNTDRQNLYAIALG